MTVSGLVWVALSVCVFALVSGRAERSPMTPPMFFTAVGLAFSGAGFGLVEVDVDNVVIHGMAELTLVVVLFIDAARIDLSSLQREEALPARLLGIGMPLTIALGALVAVVLFDGMSFAEAALVAAILAPTDAALGQAVVSNPAVPVRIRQTLNVESGLNDGIALPAVLMIASIAGALEQGGGASYWLRLAVLAVTLGPLAGILIGFLGGRAIALATEGGWVSAPFQRISGLALALLAFGCAELIGGNGFIAAFFAGMTLGNTQREACRRLYEFGEAEGQLLALLVFLVFGASMVPEAVARADAKVWAYALLSLTVVRVVPVGLSLIGSGLSTPSVAFLGWFGPRGLASILFVLLVVEPGMLERGELFESVVIVTVLLSVLLHGVTAHGLATRYGAYAAGLERSEPEHKEVAEMPLRMGSATAPHRFGP